MEGFVSPFTDVYTLNKDVLFFSQMEWIIFTLGTNQFDLFILAGGLHQYWKTHLSDRVKQFLHKSAFFWSVVNLVKALR